MSTFQEILTAVTAMRAQRMTNIDTSSVQEKVDQIEWCLQALTEAMIEAASPPKADDHEDDDKDDHKHKAKAKVHHRR